MTTYINISEKYGDSVKVSIEDYQELNPDGAFTATERGIFENGELVAEAITDEYASSIATRIAAYYDMTLDEFRQGMLIGGSLADGLSQSEQIVINVWLGRS